MEASRAGRRPERTVYALTGAGRAELDDWLAELLGTPVKEYPQFEAALSLLPLLPPRQVLGLLADRESALAKAIADERAELSSFAGLPRLFLVETEYHLAIQEAELAWVRGIVAELDAGTFPSQDGWQTWHETGEMPPEMAQFAASSAEGSGLAAGAADGMAGEAADSPGAEPLA